MTSAIPPTTAHPRQVAAPRMTRYPDFANTDLLERIPLTAQSVLYVGCNGGALGTAYRRFNPRALLLGIEPDATAAELAARRLDRVAAVDVERNPLPFALDRPIDCIIYGDVLEHLRDPWAVLRRHAEALSEDGTMVICVPNVHHWSFADRLLRGTWKYEPDGLLDETHLRWFSLDSMREGLEAVGLLPHDVSPRVFDAEKAKEFATAIAPALHNLGVDPAAYARRAAPLAVCLAGGQATAADAVGGFQHAGARRWRFACAHRVPDAGAAQRSWRADPDRRVGGHQPGSRYTAHFHSASPAAFR